MATATATVKVEHLPEFAELFRATHVLLVRRLRGQLDTPEGMHAWNDLIEAHDAIAERRTVEEPSGGGPADGEVLDDCCANPSHSDTDDQTEPASASDETRTPPT